MSNRSNILKKKFLELFKSKAGNISQLCESVGIARKTYYEWLKKDKKFEADIEAENEALIDTVESYLFKNIQQGKEASIFFFLKCKAKHRGYIEKSEMDLNVNKSLADLLGR